MFQITSLCWALAAFQVFNPIHSRKDSFGGDQPVARRVHIHRTTQTQNKRTQTSMLRAGFEPTTPVFEQAKTLHALDCAATAIGVSKLYHIYC
jgi:hypothetical protein